MNRYPRKPAIIVLLVSTFLGVACVVAWGRVEAYRKRQEGGQTAKALEQKIEELKKHGTVPAVTYFACGKALMAEKQFVRAADNFRQAVDLQPNNREYKFQLGLALVQDPRGTDAFYKFQKDLVYSDAKMAVDLFDGAEAQKHLTEERFSALAKEARNQAMD